MTKPNLFDGLQPRGHFIAIATAKYDHPPWESQPLPAVADEVATLKRWLCAQLPLESQTSPSTAFIHVHEALARNPSLAAIESALKNPPEERRFGANDAVVLFVTGHGVNIDGTHWTVLRGTEPGRHAVTALRTADLILWLRATPLRHFLLLVDMCNAGQAAADAIRSNIRLPTGWIGLASVTKYQPAGVTALTEALDDFLQEVVSDSGQKYGVQRYLKVNDFVEGLWKRLVQRGQTLTWLHSAVADPGESPCLPNPHFVSTYADDVQARRRDLALPHTDLVAHWEPRSRGVVDATDPLWLFTGRELLMQRIVRYLSGPPGSLLITGAAGTGKSAVLARLVTLSDPRFIARHRDRVNTIPSKLRPSEGAVDVAILATRKISVDILDQLCRALDVPSHTTSSAKPESLLEDWHTWLHCQTKPITVVIDAIDEATDPSGLVRDLIEQLDPGPRRHLRLLLGVRSPRIHPVMERESAGGPRSIADIVEQRLSAHRLRVDEGPWWNENDLANYANRILGETPDSPYPPSDDVLTKDMASTIASRAQRSFLLTHMAATALTRRLMPVDPADSTWLATLDAGVVGVFRDDLYQSLQSHAARLRAVHLLRAVAFAQGKGLPWATIWPKVANVVSGTDDPEYTDNDIAWLMRTRLAAYLITDREDGVTVYRLFHDALRDALRRNWLSLIEGMP